MVIFSHRGFGFGKRENSLEALSNAVKRGFSVEIDLRLSNNNIILSHEIVTESHNLWKFDELLTLIEENPQLFFALHLKEDSQQLFKDICNYIKPYKNCFLFVTDFLQNNFIISINKLIGKEQLALYITDKNIDPDLISKIDYLWLDETKNNIYVGLNYFSGFKKKIICCSPEIFTKDYTYRLKIFLNQILKERIFGVCTDYPDDYEKIVK